MTHKTKKNRQPLEPAVPLVIIDPVCVEAVPLPPPEPPLNVGEILANITPDTMDTMNGMNLAINTTTGDVLNWATNERIKLDELVKKIEDENAEAEALLSQKQIAQKRSYWRDWWRWLRGHKD